MLLSPEAKPYLAAVCIPTEKNSKQPKYRFIILVVKFRKLIYINNPGL